MKKENALPLFFLTRSLFFGLGISLICKYTSKDTYLACIAGSILGLFIIWAYKKIIITNNNSLIYLLRNSKIGFMIRILLIISSFIILLYTLLTYKTFVTSFLLSSTPVYIILAIWLILSFYAALGGLKMIHRLSSSLFIIALTLALLSIISIWGKIDYDNFLPVYTTSFKSFITSMLAFAGISTFPNLLTLHFNQNTKHYIKTYLFSVSSIIIALICINGVFGDVLVNVFRFPEYMVLKQVKLLDFIEKVENILSIAWAFDLFITTVFSIYSIKELTTKNNKYIIILLIFIIWLISSIFNKYYTLELTLYYILPFISLLFPILIIILFIYIKHHQ